MAERTGVSARKFAIGGRRSLAKTANQKNDLPTQTRNESQRIKRNLVSLGLLKFVNPVFNYFIERKTGCISRWLIWVVMFSVKNTKVCRSKLDAIYVRNYKGTNPTMYGYSLASIERHSVRLCNRIIGICLSSYVMYPMIILLCKT